MSIRNQLCLTVMSVAVRICRLLGQEVIYHIYPAKKVEELEDYIEKGLNK